ncbi:MAG: hypothetical protein DRI65_02235 [Chloroflexota bacterium]|nr:MAG: hypothetical protein DRI65_02235 [Chloroflexota bacterium]
MPEMVQVMVDQKVIANQVIYADTYQLRRQGVLGKEKLETNEGVLLVSSSSTGMSLFHSIHMFGVPFELAVAWLTRNRKIIHTKLAKPGRIYFPPGFFTDTAYILELHPEHYELLQGSTEISWEENGR